MSYILYLLVLQTTNIVMCTHVAHLWLCCCTALEYTSTKTLGYTFPALSALTNLQAVYLQKHFYNLKKEVYFASHHLVKICLFLFNDI